jgi:chaperonin cofactor prefoldin
MSALVTGVVVGVLVAIVGALANGIMNSRRDKEQWRRQQERDREQWAQQMELQTQRWEHEDLTQANQWAHEDELRNHDERLKACVALMAQTSGFRFGGSLLYAPDPSKALDDLKEAMETSNDHVETLGLVAKDKKLYEAAQELRSKLRALYVKNMLSFVEKEELDLENPEIAREFEEDLRLDELDMDTLQRSVVEAAITFRNVVRTQPGFRA